MLLLSCSIFAQMHKFPNGVYLTKDQLKNQTPAYDINLRVSLRSAGDLFWSGGNDYKLESDIDSLNNKYIRNMIFAYVKNDSIYLNCHQLNLKSGYSLCLTSGNFLAFHATMTNKEYTKAALLGGAIGAAIASDGSHLKILSLRTGNVKPLTKAYLNERIKDHPDLLSAYKDEHEPESEETIIKYVNFLNRVTSPYSFIGK
jgi:hypothetical protein